MLQERRQSPRIPFFETVSIQTMEKPLAIPGHSIELSAHGIALCSDIPLQSGHHCTIALSVEHGNLTRHITLQCESRNCSVTEDCRGYRLGLRFVDLQDAEAALIEDVVQYELSQA